MSIYRNNLPQISDEIFLTDGGLETTLLFHDKFELPLFAAFDLLKNDEGQTAMKNYYRRYTNIAKNHGVGFILESPTWRASSKWGSQLGYSDESLVRVNHEAVKMMTEIREEFNDTKTVISGCIGPHGDGYSAEIKLSEAEAREYHSVQINTFAKTAADMVSALTINYTEEAIGIAKAAKATNIPSVISFTVETDGTLPSGQTLKDAINQVDSVTNKAPAYYMINCAHPTHFEDATNNNEPWLKRIRGIRANASTKSHAELDQSEELDEGNPEELGDLYKKLRSRMKHVTIMGGCCGTDHRHIDAILKSCMVPS